MTYKQQRQFSILPGGVSVTPSGLLSSFVGVLLGLGLFFFFLLHSVWV